jgi:4-amino-4-deoxy-L-arabinose transferase-like glycosyltransferase
VTAAAAPSEACRGLAAHAGVFALALAVRTIHVLQLRASPAFDFMIGDARSYSEWGRRIADGDWLGTEVFYQAPLYPYFLGVLHATVGGSPLAVRLCQAVLGALACAMLGAAAARWFSPRVGVVTGILAALYAPAIFFDGIVQKSTLDLFFLSALLWAMASVEHRPRVVPAAVVGALLGALVLTRENALVFLPPLLVWFLWRRPPGRAWRMAAAFAAGVVLLLAPVALRNHAIGGGFHLTTSQLGPNLYIGNHEKADGTYVPLRFGRGDARYERQDATEIAERAVGRPLTPGEVSSWFTSRALGWITSHPLDWLALTGRKLLLALHAVELVDTEDQYTFARWSTPLAVLNPVSHFGILAPLAALGVALTWRHRRRLWVLLAMAACYGMTLLAFYVFGRYRYPLVPFALPFAAAALVHAWPWLRAARPRARSPWRCPSRSPSWPTGRPSAPRRCRQRPCTTSASSSTPGIVSTRPNATTGKRRRRIQAWSRQPTTSATSCSAGATSRAPKPATATR